jgi:hypothetical protein
VIETLQPELAKIKETQAHLTAELEATKKQMANMYQIIQSIRQASGVYVQLPAQAPVRHFTPVSMKVVGLRAIGIVDLRAIGIVDTSILSLTHAISSLLCSLRRWVQTIPLPCHRLLIASTLCRSPVLHRSPGGHTCSLHRRSRDVELFDFELVIINL